MHLRELGLDFFVCFVYFELFSVLIINLWFLSMESPPAGPGAGVRGSLGCSEAAVGAQGAALTWSL